MSTDSVEEFEYDWDPTKKTTTGWSRRVVANGRTRRTYSRRGSTGDATFGSEPFTRLQTLSSHHAGIDGETESFSSLGDNAIRTGQWSDKSACDPFREDWQDSSSRTRPPRARRFTRANSLSLSNVSHIPEPSTLRRSYSVSSRSNTLRSITTDISENFDPNFDPLEMNASPKRGAAIDSDSRGRKKVRSARNHTPLSTLSASNSSFSHLARHGDGGLSWARQSSDTSAFLKFSGVDFVGYQTDATSSPATASVGSSRKRSVCGSPSGEPDYFSTSGNLCEGGVHVRSRSRIFSPPTARLSLLDMGSSGDKGNRTMDITSDDGVDTDLESAKGDDSGDDASVESEGNNRQAIPSFAARSPLSGFTDLPLHPGKKVDSVVPSKHHETVLRSMPCYKDLKFLLSVLRKENVGSNQSWHVAPPAAWEKSRRTSFFQWSASLGFTMRAGGMGISYLQISKIRGGEVLRLLEASYKECKEQANRDKVVSGTGVTPTASKSQVMGLKSNTKQSGKGNGYVEYKTEPIVFGFVSLPNSIHTIGEKNDDVDLDLLERMGSLGVSDECQVTCTLPTMESRIVFEEENVLPSDVESSRPSMENHASTRDLMCHLHGMSPVRKRGAPLRLSIQSISSIGTGCKHVSASPFPTPSMGSAGLNSQSKLLSFDFVETPMMKQPEQGWGSCPVRGRDWGLSESCHETIIKELVQRFNQSYEDAGFCISPLEPRSADLGFDLEAASCYREQADSPTSVSNSEFAEDAGLYDATIPESPATINFQASSTTVLEKVVGSCQIYGNMDDNQYRLMRRRKTSVAKHKRMSLIASVMEPTRPIIPPRKSLFTLPSKTNFIPSEQFIRETMSSNKTFCELGTTCIDNNANFQQRCPVQIVVESPSILELVFSHLQEHELLQNVSLVSTTWSDVVAHAHANLMLMSVGCSQQNSEIDYDSDEGDSKITVLNRNLPGLLERSWAYLIDTFPWACFLSEGAFKRVYKVYNSRLREEEALSVMDVDMISSNGNINVVGTELAVTVMLGSLVRRGICPNFVASRGVFSCPFEPPASHWGSASNKCPKGKTYGSPKSTRRRPREPKHRGLFQYIRMELCDGGDVEEYLKQQPDQALLPNEARQLLFQISFALHASADRFSMKHYDVKLLNVFLRRCSNEFGSGNVVLRYGIGAHMFALSAPRERAFIAKLADYGTANVKAESTGQGVTIAQFTTLENTPPEFLFLGDHASQGHGHDCFGLGLCMLHLFTGHAPYEEILQDVVCPFNLKRKLRRLWEDENVMQFSVVRSVILQDVFLDDDGNVVDGKPDETLYDTLYRYLVLFGIPESITNPHGAKVFLAIKEALVGVTTTGKSNRVKKKESSDSLRFSRDRKKYSLLHGNNKYIARARKTLEVMDGGLELIFSLVSFNPQERFSALDVLNSTFMASLQETPEVASEYKSNDTVYSYTAFSTHTAS